VLIVALLGAGFYALLHGIPRPGVHPTATATRIAATSTAALSMVCHDPRNGAPTQVTMPPPVPNLPAAEILSFLVKHEHTPAFFVGGSAPGGNWKALTYRYYSPVLVLPATYGAAEFDCIWSLPHYIVSATVSNGWVILYDFVYNPTTQLLWNDSVSGSSHLYAGKPFQNAGDTSSTAIAALWSAKGQDVAAGTRPELVYFAPRYLASGDPWVPHWKGGGTDAMNPIWRLHGANGLLYFVGTDGKVYTPDQLPVQSGTTIISNE
jgi:hypothetical protein